MPDYHLSETDRRDLAAMLAWWRQQPPAGGGSLRHRTLADPIPLEFGKALARSTATGATASTDQTRIQLWKVSGGAEQAAGTTANCYDWFGIGASPGDKVYVQRHRQSGRRYFHVLPGRLISGKLTAALSSSSTVCSIDGVYAYWGANPTTSTGATISVWNKHGWSAPDGGWVDAVENRNSTRGTAWEAWQMDCT